jgi:hypothetical protein
MATEAQVHANRSNAQKSTGPRTAEGKAAVAQNAVKHGLSGRLDVIKGEDQEEFDRHREEIRNELAPAGTVESMLVERVASLSWRLKRAERMQNEVFDALLADGATPLAKLARSLAGDRSEEDSEPALGRAVLKDFSGSRVLDRLLMYERRIEHSLRKTLDDLKKLRVLGYISRQMDEIGGPPGGGCRCAVSGFKSDESDFASSQLRTSHFEFCTASATPDDVTTNAPGGPDADRMSATRMTQHSNIPSFQYSPPGPDGPLADDESCETNPIGLDPCETQAFCGTGVTECPAQDRHEETKPIAPAETNGFARAEGRVGN